MAPGKTGEIINSLPRHRKFDEQDKKGEIQEI
jgi:hypothetical protein